jgi:type 1 fimbriae regulatory protein FimB/type 1 fimbriae regulatory protein FimE
MRNKGLTAKRRRAPTIENGTLPPPRRPYGELRPREFLTGEEIERLRKACGERLGRHPHRDSTMILLAYRHGLRVTELVGLRWDMLDLDQGLLHVRRLKRGRPSTHILRGGELRALRRLHREQVPSSPYLFTTERHGPMTAAGFRKLLARVGQAADFPFPVHRTRVILLDINQLCIIRR